MQRCAAAGHDGNGPLAWCIGNVVGHYDARSNGFPRRTHPRIRRSTQRWLIMALARCMTNKTEVSVYETAEVDTLRHAELEPRRDCSGSGP